MNNVHYISIFLFIFFLLFPHLVFSAQTEVYIAYFGGNSEQKTVQEIQEKHHSHLLFVKKTEKDAKRSLIYTYKHINGFAAHLTREEASKLSEMEEVVSVFPSRTYSLHTTRSWDFTRYLEWSTDSNGMSEEEVHRSLKSKYGRDVVIGFIDQGIWPESESFNDGGMGPIPKSWKGTCESGDAFNSSNCNKKLIGARFYIKGYEAEFGEVKNGEDYLSPRDKIGHGTHTSSTAGGRAVPNVSALGGYARGTATGGAPLARLAMYKVVWPKGASNVDLLAAIDGAIDDGVDVLSISMGADAPESPDPYNEDTLAIGALHAVQKNIAVAFSAGNSGPSPATLDNVAPWAITVGASSVDRKFPSSIMLGNGAIIQGGESITPNNLEKKMYPLAYADQVAYNTNVTKNLSGLCFPGVLSPAKAKGKIIVCLRGSGNLTRLGAGLEVKRAGGVGLVLGNNKAFGNSMELDVHFLPAIALSYTNALKILDYINYAKHPRAYIAAGKTVLNNKPAPFMASFSSRGPSRISPNILKPDIAAPGINILAAYSEASSPTETEGDNRVVKYNIMSGTSMSCPHVAGALALLKGMHPNWSSAALRSALMTSAGLSNTEGNLITDEFGNPADPFQFGSGYFRPTKAADPGLVYDASYTDYLMFLCGMGYKKMDRTFTCPDNPPSPANLNYPSLAIPELNETIAVVRTVTNVGRCRSVYRVSIESPLGILIEISPDVLHFHRAGQKMNFTILVKKVEGEFGEKGEYRFGWFTWSDDQDHRVRSPVAISVA